MAIDFKLRAVVSALERGYVVSVSKLSNDRETEILGEDEVDDIEAAHQFLEKVAQNYSFPVENIERYYNIKGKITNRPPKGRK